MRHFPLPFRAMLFIALSWTPLYAQDAAEDIFSHSVLNLPHEPREEFSWVRVLSDQETWTAFYRQLYTDAEQEAPEHAPAFDFDHYQVIVGGVGLQYHGGFSIAVGYYHEFDSERMLDTLLIRPGPDCTTTTALNYPSLALLVPRSDKPLRVRVNDLVQYCSFAGQ